MTSNDRRRIEARSRANRRLRGMTIGTLVFGLTATGVLGFAAAASTDGSSASAGAGAATTTTTDTAANGRIGSDDRATTPAAPTVTGSSRSAHASTGGS